MNNKNANVKDANNSNTKKESSTETIPDIKDRYEIISVDGKKFAYIKNGNPDNVYCPYCYSQVNPKTNSCYQCNHNF